MAETTITTTESTQAVANKPGQTKYNTDFSLGIFGSSDNFMMATQMAKAFANSTIVPREYQGNYANGLVAIEMAVRMKTSPLMVMQGLDVIQGRPAWRSQFLIALINTSGKFDTELQFEEENDKNGKPYSCYCWAEKNGRKITSPLVTMDMANAEGWINKNGSKWKTMPQIMLRYRAASFFCSMNCPEVKFGLHTAEEEMEIDHMDHDDFVLNEQNMFANSMNFPVDEPKLEEPKETIEIVTEVKENETVIPEFMKSE